MKARVLEETRLCLFSDFVVAEHTQDKQIQREEEYYDDDNDNDHDMEDS